MSYDYETSDYHGEPPSYDNISDSNDDFKKNVVFKSSQEEALREIIFKYEINNDFAARLQLLQQFKIVFIFDDSGSMNTTLLDSPLNNSSSLLKVTRWDELQYFSSIAVEIAGLFDPDGCSVYFLNRCPI